MLKYFLLVKKANLLLRPPAHPLSAILSYTVFEIDYKHMLFFVVAFSITYALLIIVVMVDDNKVFSIQYSDHTTKLLQRAVLVALILVSLNC